MATTATDKTTITYNYPEWAGSTLTWDLLSSIAINSASEVILQKSYDVTLDENGEASDDLPTPDSTGDAAWLWRLNHPDGTEPLVSFGYSENGQDAATLLAAEVSTTTASDIAALVTNKQDKDTAAVSGNAAMMNDDGEAVDAGTAFTDLETTTGSQAKADAAQAAAEATAAGLYVPLTAIKPVAISDMSATATGSTTIDLVWTYTTVAPITGFKVYRKEGVSGTYALIDTANSGDVSYNDGGLTPETEYYYRLDAYNTFFQTAGNDDNATTTALQPDDIASLILWLDASAITGLSDGQAVATWVDQSGNNLNATQATGTKQPTYKTNILGGKPVVRFDGGDGLLTPVIDWGGAGAATVIMVLKDTSSTEHMYIELSPTYSSNEGTYIFYKLASDRVFAGANMTSGSPPFTARRLASTTKFNIMSAIFDFTQTVTVPTFTTDNSVLGFIDGLRSDGSEGGGIGGYMQPNPAEITDGFSLYIGARNQSNTYFTGDMAEVIVFGERLAPTQRAQLTSYLNTKYSLTYADGLIVYLGDSMTAGDNATSPYPFQLDALLIADGQDFNYGNYGRNGTESDDIDNYSSESDPFYNLNGGRNVAMVWAGTNDLRFGESLATLQSRFQTLCENRQAKGWETWVLTMLPRSDVGTPGTFETNRLAFNSWLSANYTSWADGIVDVAADSRLDDETDGTYYSGDNVHLSNTGLGVVAELVKAAAFP